jgi:hypothetical protein
MGADETLAVRMDRLESAYEVGKLVQRYAMAADSRDVGSIVDMFVDDVDCGRFGTGREALRAFYEVAHRQFYRTIHQVVGHVADLDDPDHATGKTVMRAEHEVGERWIVVLMCLFDTYERRDGRWYFVRRRPEQWYASDVAERPSGPDWNRWPAGWEARLPQSFETWARFWEGHEEEVARLTDYPA